MTAILSLFSNLKMIAGLALVAAIAAAALYCTHLRHEVARLQANVAQAQVNVSTARQVAMANADALTKAQAQAKADMAAVQAHDAALAQLTSINTLVLTRIENAPETDDGPVAPVLKLALDCLRDQTGGATGAANQICQSPAPSVAHDLPKAAPGS